MNFEEWDGFEVGDWTAEINVRDFIQKNYTPYEGNGDFLANATPKTQKLWDKVLALYEKEKNSDIKDDKLIEELREIAKKFEHTKNIEKFLIHPKFPVDVRHNAKIFREKLAVWAIGK